ncbi:hypothetical protein ACNKU7_18610 [Microbulbifer sp. SA54]|uniref:hypothetical protein n=1 Tax=Microbulbifer sp. SA54 TaxID=3401577 RepID=UPI003AAA9426
MAKKWMVLLLLGVKIFGCSSHQKKHDLSAEEFRASFEKDCKIIDGIEELHKSTWYTVNGSEEGWHTKESFSLEEMSGWLRACGRDPNGISKIQE